MYLLKMHRLLRCFFFYFPSLSNNLPPDIREGCLVNVFKDKLDTQLVHPVLCSLISRIKT